MQGELLQISQPIKQAFGDASEVAVSQLQPLQAWEVLESAYREFFQRGTRDVQVPQLDQIIKGSRFNCLDLVANKQNLDQVGHVPEGSFPYSSDAGLHKDHLRNGGLCDLRNLFDVIFRPTVNFLVVLGHFIWIFTQNLILTFMGMEGEEEKEKEVLVHCPEKISIISYKEQKNPLSTADELWHLTVVQLSGLFCSIITHDHTKPAYAVHCCWY